MIRFLVCLACLAALSAASAGAELINVGELYPEVRLPTIDGKTVNTRDLRGKKVLLVEFASW